MYTVESVASGHPDKIADQISDFLLDYFLGKNSNAHVAVECMVSKDIIIISGEVGGVEYDIQKIQYMVLDFIDHKQLSNLGFHRSNLKVLVYLHGQSREIDSSVTMNDGAGDQGIVFGYAEDTTTHYMPIAIHYAHSILRNIENAIITGKLKGLRKDAKSQVTFSENGDFVSTLVLSIQHDVSVSVENVLLMLMPYIRETFGRLFKEDETEVLINPSGSFIEGGPSADCGLTGRKIIIDSYGAGIPHGGGAFSGKDPTKIDRSAAYFARYLCKNIVASGLAGKCLMSIAYVIGLSNPVDITLQTYGTSSVSEGRILAYLRENIDFSVIGIINTLNLRRPIYMQTSVYGHFGRDISDGNEGFSWECLDMVETLKKIL
ncbi:MAG: methionine adenosyltransferase [Candidatus Xenolissoclinum pacificiensis L6]|uniref:Methionine adenosyltransferase n=1 Tax=Candidatus Xenolissoclinum pacificiensis L6 TaxID=1401685 RepID=W2V2H5_9RICK|nr:MAG: methionine adenosyltransferase [Candidatus Xenolissoclinum pacificiensis L6]